MNCPKCRTGEIKASVFTEKHKEVPVIFYCNVCLYRTTSITELSELLRESIFAIRELKREDFQS